MRSITEKKVKEEKETIYNISRIPSNYQKSKTNINEILKLYIIIQEFFEINSKVI
jgi:hypothetical protein